jgi:hydroxyacyl-ACP dehydratase HTD2-like protein with hotdog domain
MSAGDVLDGSAWVGRETRQRLRASRDTVECFEATLDRPVPGGCDDLAPLRHWLWVFAPPATATGRLAPDGHPPRGELVPDWPLPRRMWAGSDVRFHEAVPIDAPLERVVTVESANVKHGRSGTLGFVVLRHRWLLDGRCAIDDAQTVVYREPVAAGATVAHAPPPSPALPPEPGAWSVEHRPSEVLLFRYSALTFNSHRIHYDAAYTREVEGYPGLVVQGPLMATLMLDAFRDAHPRARVLRFSFRALQPAFAGQAIVCGGVPDGDGRSRLWVRDTQGREHVAGEVLHD